jgi:hypothetical protein
MEDSSDDEHGVVESGKLLDRLFDKALLPKYAFPTDVATFSVFEDSADPWKPKRRYSPQQSLNAALSQYAPGHEVWVDGKRHISLGLYAEHEKDRFQAYQNRRLYFQCRACNYADLLSLDQGYPDQTRDCPACGGRATLGPARRWVRPPGFSHPPSVTALPPDFDAGPPLRPTRATLDYLQSADSMRLGREAWPIGTGWEAWSDTKTLVVTNRGSLSATDPGFRYCTQCGRIEPADFDPTMRQLGGGQPHTPGRSAPASPINALAWSRALCSVTSSLAMCRSSGWRFRAAGNLTPKFLRSLEKGFFLGYRRRTSGGTWLARRRQADGGYTEHRIGNTDDLEAALREETRPSAARGDEAMVLFRSAGRHWHLSRTAIRQTRTGPC